MTATQSNAKGPSEPARHFLSGLSSGMASAAVLQPLDLLKTRVQQSGHKPLRAYWQDLNQSSHRIQNLWRGTLPSTLRTGFGAALYFTSLNSMRRYIQQTGSFGPIIQSPSASSMLPALTSSANLISGAAARTFAGFLLMPLTVIKVRFESSLFAYPSMMSAIKDIHHCNGARGFFSGFGATAMRDAPYAGLYVLFYEMFKSRLGALAVQTYKPTARQQEMTSIVASSVNFTSGIAAGTICSIISNPIDVCKTRIQLQPRRYRNLIQASHTILGEEGFRSFWNGLALRMSRKALSSALSWTIYEELVRRFSSNMTFAV